MEFSYTRSMWLFSLLGRKKKKSTMEKIVAGVIIGGAIGSIIGKKLLEKHREHEEGKEDDE